MKATDELGGVGQVATTPIPTTSCALGQVGTRAGYRRRVSTSRNEFFRKLAGVKGDWVLFRTGGIRLRTTKEDGTPKWLDPIEACGGNLLAKNAGIGLNENFKWAVVAAADGKEGRTRRQILKAIGEVRHE